MNFYIKGFRTDEGHECDNDVYWGRHSGMRNGYRLVYSSEDATVYKSYGGAVRAWTALESKKRYIKELDKYEWKIIEIHEVNPENLKEPQR